MEAMAITPLREHIVHKNDVDGWGKWMLCAALGVPRNSQEFLFHMQGLAELFQLGTHALLPLTF